MVTARAIFSCQEFSSFFPLSRPEQILFSLFRVSSFRMNYGSALAWPQEDARKVPGQSTGVGALSGTFPGTPPSGQSRDVGADWRRPKDSNRKRGIGAPATDPSNPRPGAAFQRPPGRRRPRTLTPSGAGRDRWRRGRRLRLGSAAASRPATRPQGRRPARGSEPRGGGGGLASMARGSG